MFILIIQETGNANIKCTGFLLWPPPSCTASTGTTPRPPRWSSSCAGPPASPSASPSCAASTTGPQQTPARYSYYVVMEVLVRADQWSWAIKLSKRSQKFSHLHSFIICQCNSASLKFLKWNIIQVWFLFNIEVSKWRPRPLNPIIVPFEEWCWDAKSVLPHVLSSRHDCNNPDSCQPADACWCQKWK